VVDSRLAEAYDRCRRLHRRHGRTYYLATLLLPPGRRRHVHALYGFARYADEIVDETGPTAAAERERRLAELRAGLAGSLGDRDHPILPAVRHTIEVCGLDRADFTAFLDSMAMDLTVTSYPTYDDLLSYMDGSAAAIGTMMLPILGTRDPTAAREPARQLGFAFQLTNFIRDVAEDLGRGRIYLPLADLARFGLSTADLRAAAAAGKASPEIRALIGYEIARAREHYAAAAPGIPMLSASARACIRTAYHLYGGILDEVERSGCDVFAGRAAVPRRRRVSVALRCLVGVPV
jgi:phytoene synthase